MLIPSRRCRHATDYTGIVRSLQLACIVYLFACCAAFADIPSVVHIIVSGQDYQVVELIEHRKYLFNRHPELWRYKTLEDRYCVTLNRKEYNDNKELLKYLPDNRDFYSRHPHLQKLMFVINAASLAMNILQVLGI